MWRILLVSALLAFSLPIIYAAPPQKKDKDPAELRKLIEATSTLEYQVVLNRYVYDLYLDYGTGKIEDEKYLISQMYLVNAELAQRLENPGKARENYYNDLSGMMLEIQDLKGRLEVAGIRELDTFVEDLEDRIQYTIDQEEVDFKKKTVFEDALRMLYVSEEMIKLDQLQSPGDITQRIGKSKQKLMSAFGEISSGDYQAQGKKPSIYDLFAEWKRTEQAKYSLRLADVKLVRDNLLKSAGQSEILRMFNNQLELAYTQFNYGEYQLAGGLLNDIIEKYPSSGVKNIDDVFFYRAESHFAQNKMMHARKDYEELLNEYPNTGYLAATYGRLVQINYALNNFRDATENALLYQNVSSPQDADYYDIHFFLAMSYYELGNFDRTVETLLNIPPENPYYHLAQYFIGNAYSDSELYDEAVRTYLGMIGSKGTPPHLLSRALYKMGLLEYERGNYGAAIEYLAQINREFKNYDKVLNALAWSYFENERSKPVGEIRDFYQARYYAEALIADYYASPHKMEAGGLLAYVNQLENQPLEAIDLYREIYQTKVSRGSIDAYLVEKKQLEVLYQEALDRQEEALRQNNRAAYLKASSIAVGLEDEILALDVAESSQAGLSSYREVNTVLSQIRELNQLRLQAEEQNNPAVIARIDSVQFRLAAALEDYPESVFEADNPLNLFDDHPVSKYVAEEQFRHEDMLQKRQQVTGEISEIDVLLREVEDRVSQARAQENFFLVAKLEEQHSHLLKLRENYDQLLVATYETETLADPYPEFNRWGDLGAFGIINVYFDQKQKTQKKLVNVAEVLDRVNTQLNQRKQVIESKVRKIESEIRFMTMKARMEERARLRADRERAFRESYFDTRESESLEEEQ